MRNYPNAFHLPWRVLAWLGLFGSLAIVWILGSGSASRRGRLLWRNPLLRMVRAVTAVGVKAMSFTMSLS